MSHTLTICGKCRSSQGQTTHTECDTAHAHAYSRRCPAHCQCSRASSELVLPWATHLHPVRNAAAAKARPHTSNTTQHKQACTRHTHSEHCACALTTFKRRLCSLRAWYAHRRVVDECCEAGGHITVAPGNCSALRTHKPQADSVGMLASFGCKL